MQSWDEIAAAFAGRYPGDVWTRGLERWRADVAALPAGKYVLENLGAEHQLPLETKLQMLFITLGHYRPCVMDDGIPTRIAADRLVNEPLMALQVACGRFPDLGAPIPPSPPCGEVSRFMKFGHAPSILPYEGPQSVYHSWSGRAWNEVLSGRRPLKGKDLLQRLQGKIRGGEEINVFSTRAEWVDDQDVYGAELSARVRDLLGCPHLDGHGLIEIRIPENEARATGAFSKPTFADAGGYPPFLCSTDADAYGYGRDISALRPGERGGPEIWHGPLPSRVASGVRYLPAATERLPPGEWSDFVAYSTRPR
jgi:hypothetical protein